MRLDQKWVGDFDGMIKRHKIRFLVPYSKTFYFLSTDRVAIDAVGVAILKLLGSNDNIMKQKIFKQEQIDRAIELGLGVSSPSEVDLISADEQSREYRDRVVKILNRG